jgi:hypothetical protein
MAAKKSKGEGLPRLFHFRLTERDGAIWDDKVARSGMTQSEFFRTAVVRNETLVQGDASGNKKKRAVRTPNNVNPDIRKANFLLAQASNNLNQIAFRLNSDNTRGLVTPAVYAAALDELQSISVALKERF